MVFVFSASLRYPSEDNTRYFHHRENSLRGLGLAYQIYLMIK